MHRLLSGLAIKYIVYHYLKKGVYRNFLETSFWMMNIGFNTLSNQQINTIADIGANVGIFAIAARIAFPHAEIHCYEPNVDNIPHLNNQAESLGLKTFEEAVSNIDGTCSLSKSTIHDTSARITNLECGEIPLTSLHKVLYRFESQQIDLLKLDCEGSEFEI